MAFSSISFTANSSANSGKDYAYSFGAIAHNTDNIKVLIGGTNLTSSQYSVVQGTVTLNSAPGAGSAPFDAALSSSNVLKIYRQTNRTTAEVVFSANSVIQDEDLNTATDQGRFLALEAVDRANESIAIDDTDASRYNVQIDGASKRIFGVATPTNDLDAVNKAYSDTNVNLAATSATNAANSATAAASSATASANSASTSSTQATNSSNSATTSSEWASKTNGQVASTDYSAKAWSIGGTGVTDTAGKGAAKEWATAAEDDLVDGSEYSAKHYSAKASASATEADAASLTNSIVFSIALG